MLNMFNPMSQLFQIHSRLAMHAKKKVEVDPLLNHAVPLSLLYTQTNSKHAISSKAVYLP